MNRALSSFAKKRSLGIVGKIKLLFGLYFYRPFLILLPPNPAVMPIVPAVLASVSGTLSLGLSLASAVPTSLAASVWILKASTFLEPPPYFEFHLLSWIALFCGPNSSVLFISESDLHMSLSSLATKDGESFIFERDP